MQEMLAVYKISYNNTVGTGGGSLLVGFLDNRKVFVYKGTVDIPDLMVLPSAIIVKFGTQACRQVLKTMT